MICDPAVYSATCCLPTGLSQYRTQYYTYTTALLLVLCDRNVEFQESWAVLFGSLYEMLNIIRHGKPGLAGTLKKIKPRFLCSTDMVVQNQYIII